MTVFLLVIGIMVAGLLFAMAINKMFRDIYEGKDR